MALDVIVYRIREHYRSSVVCDALAQGIAAAGERVRVRYENEYGGLEGDVAVFYGLEGNLGRILEEYGGARRALYVDLGYWGRREGGRWSGYHKIVVNARHPTKYFRAGCDDRRRLAHGIAPAPWRKRGSHILLAGMGDKGARAEGYAPEEWERWAIAEIRRYSQRPIVYRPKPSWKHARAIAGVGYSPRTQPVEQLLPNCHAVVTHHSNVAVDGLVAGVPCFVWGGVASTMGLQELGAIESPWLPEGREQWVNDITYCQWSIAEMSSGLPWRYMRSRGLV